MLGLWAGIKSLSPNTKCYAVSHPEISICIAPSSRVTYQYPLNPGWFLFYIGSYIYFYLPHTHPAFYRFSISIDWITKINTLSMPVTCAIWGCGMQAWFFKHLLLFLSRGGVFSPPPNPSCLPHLRGLPTEHSCWAPGKNHTTCLWSLGMTGVHLPDPPLFHLPAKSDSPCAWLSFR